jgi:hypothetical protein
MTQPQTIQSNVLIFDSMELLLKDIITKYKNDSAINYVLDQIIAMHSNCFESKNAWNPRAPWNKDGSPYYPGVIIDITDRLEVIGFLNIARNKKDGNKIEIYNLCVNPKYRNKNVSGRMLNALPKDTEYYLQVLFKNKPAYYAYSKYFFCDFLGIGRLSYSDQIGFIMGGMVNNQCSEDQKNTIRDMMDKISQLIQIIEERTGGKFDNYFQHYMANKGTYDFINKQRDLVVNVYRLREPTKIQLSQDILRVLEFGNPTNPKNPMWVNLMFIDNNIFTLINNFLNKNLI